MATDFRPKLLLAEISMFLVIQVLALLIGYRLISTQQVEYLPAAQAIWTFLAAMVVATILLIVFLKYFKGPTSSKLFFALILFVGVNIVFEAFFPALIAFILTVFIVGARFLKPNVFTHNLVFFLALAGVGARLGTLIPVVAAIILLIVLSVYDFTPPPAEELEKLFKRLSAGDKENPTLWEKK